MLIICCVMARVWSDPPGDRSKVFRVPSPRVTPFRSMGRLAPIPGRRDPPSALARARLPRSTPIALPPRYHRRTRAMQRCPQRPPHLTDEERYPPILRGRRPPPIPPRAAPLASSASAPAAPKFHRHHAASFRLRPEPRLALHRPLPTLHGVRATDGAAMPPTTRRWSGSKPTPSPPRPLLRRRLPHPLPRAEWHITHADLLARHPRPARLQRRPGRPHPRHQRPLSCRQALSISTAFPPLGRSPRLRFRADWASSATPSSATSSTPSSPTSNRGTRAPLAPPSPPSSTPTTSSFTASLWASWGFDFDDQRPRRPRAPTQHESSATSPAAADFVVPEVPRLLPSLPAPQLRRFDYCLHKLVDLQVVRLLRRLGPRFRDDTIIVLHLRSRRDARRPRRHARSGTTPTTRRSVPSSSPAPASPPAPASTTSAATSTSLPPSSASPARTQCPPRPRLAERLHRAQPLVGRDLAPSPAAATRTTPPSIS